MLHDVFDKLLCSDSGERICAQYEKGIKCAQIFLLKRSGLSKSDRLTAVPFEIQGMSTIWNIAMSEHATEKVISECESFIVKLHLHLDDKEVDRHAVWSSLIGKCMKCASSSHRVTRKRSVRSESWVRSIKSFTSPYPQDGGGSAEGFTNGKRNDDRVISLMIEPMNFGKDRGGLGQGKKFVYYTIPLSETVAHLRDRVALDLRMDPKCLMMKSTNIKEGLSLRYVFCFVLFISRILSIKSLHTHTHTNTHTQYTGTRIRSTDISRTQEKIRSLVSIHRRIERRNPPRI